MNGNAGEIRSLTPYSMIKYNKDRQIEDSNIANTYFLIIISSVFIKYKDIGILILLIIIGFIVASMFLK